MRKLSKTLIVTLLTIVTMVCTSCNDRGDDSSFSLAGINLSGVKYLALGSQGSNAKDGEEDMSSQSMLYSIDEEGNMQLVAYEYDCDEEGLVTEISRNITISINQIAPVGDNYIWLVGCRYICEDYSGFSESMQDRIRGMVNHSIEYTENFLIRKSDGKIFDLNGVIGAFPYCIFNIPEYGNLGFVAVGGYEGGIIDGALTGDRLRKLGLINQHNGDIYLAPGHWAGNLQRMHDNGNTLSMITVLPGSEEQPINIAYSITDNDGHLGTCISYGSNIPHVASIMADDGTLPAIQGIPVGDEFSGLLPEMRCIGGKFFVSVNSTNISNDSIYLVNINGPQVTATAVSRGHFSKDDTYNLVNYVSDEETYSWTYGTSLYTFNSTTYELTESSLPDGWPEYGMYDAEGYYYEPHMANGLKSFTIYNLATLQTEEVSCDRSQVPTYNFYKGCNYDGGLKAFVESIIMADGSTATILTPVSGPERGISQIGSQTEPNNNVEITILIPLN